LTSKDFEDAVDSIKNNIDRLLFNEFHIRGRQWVNTWYDLSLDWSESEPHYVVFPEGEVTRLLKLAEADREVFELAIFAAGTRLACSADFSCELREFASDYLKGNISPPRARAGRPSKQTWGRDFIIIDSMRYLELSMEIPMTQNIERKGERNCETTSSEIVEAAIHLSNLPNLTRLQIERIWARSKVQEEYNETMKLCHNSLLDDANGMERS
jgi:hypothetical protein